MRVISRLGIAVYLVLLVMFPTLTIAVTLFALIYAGLSNKQKEN
jgi:hypothetical protein